MTPIETRDLLRGLHACARTPEPRARVLARISGLPLEPLERDALGVHFDDHRAAYLLEQREELDRAEEP